MQTFIALFLLLSALVIPVASAEQRIVESGYEVHYNAFNSSFITPEVAQANGLIRSKVMALLNLSVLKVAADGSTTPVSAVVRGEARNLLQQIRPIEFTKIDEGDAIYYIGSFRFSDEEMMNFTLTVQPTPDIAPIEVRFSQTFYEDR